MKTTTHLQNHIELSQTPFFDPFTFGETPPYPVVAELGAGELHRVNQELGTYSLQEIICRFESKLIRSDLRINPKGDNEWRCAIFKTRAGHFILFGERGATVYSRQKNAATRLAKRLLIICQSQKKLPTCAGYSLVKRASFDMNTEFVPLTAAKTLTDSEFALLYGDTFLPWHQKFNQRFSETQSGISILEGPPGCGKTTFIKSLIAANAETHRFYFIPPQDIRLLTEPEFIVLWSWQRKKFKDHKLVLVIEDAEQALQSRENDNRTMVSTLLNYSDGLLSEFLKMQIICTINCKASDIDPALMRPGRLLSHRIFHRLPINEALRLAEAHGIKLSGNQSDYSLAEIFNEAAEIPDRPKSIVGFAA